MTGREVIGATSGGTALDDAVLGRHAASIDYAARARRWIAGGVASAARAARRPVPLLLDRAEGSAVVDADGRRYVDYVGAFGPALLGHSHPAVVDAVQAQLARGVLFGSSHRGEAELADRVTRVVPCADQVAFAGSGSDAAFLATRIARARTGRPLVLKFEGQYHGWLDPLYVNVPGVAPQEGDGPLDVVHGTPGMPAPPGVVVCRWNDLPALERTFGELGDRIALVLMEAVACNFGAYDPDPGYIAGVRELCDRAGCLLGFDEVITGFRLGLGGAQERAGVTPDLAVFAKALATGLPIGMVAGTAEAMSVVADGPVRVQGTTNGAALSVAAANAALALLEAEGGSFYADLDRRADALARGLVDAAADAGAPLVVNRVGSVLQLLWSRVPTVRAYADVWAADPAPIADLALGLLGHGVHALERGLWFVSATHSEDDVARTIDAFAAVLPDVVRRHGRAAIETEY